MFQKSVNREYKSRQFLQLSQSFAQWMETLSYTPRTVKLATWHVNEFFSFLERNNVTHLKDFRNEHVNQYFEYLQHRPNCMNGGSLCANSINNHVTALRRLGKYLQLTGKASFTIKPELLKVSETATFLRSAERSVGEECRVWWSPDP